MKHFTQIGTGINVDPILKEIDANPALWGSYDIRQKVEGSPHSDTTDICLRGPDPAEMAADRTYVSRPHLSVFWPGWDLLPSLHHHVFVLAAHIRATGIGGILLTRMQPGARIDWHTDPYWHAVAYNPKLYVPLRSNEKCVNYVEDETLVMRPGEIWSFDNDKLHAVTNDGDEERIMAIICYRTT
jgi:hypothetical protein